MDSPPPTKKPKKHQDSENQKEDKKKKKKIAKGKAGGTLTLDELKLLGHQLLSSRAHINNLPILLSLLSSSSSSSPELALESFLSLQSFFVPLIPEIPSASSPTSAGERKRKSAGSGGAAEEKDAESVFKVWIRERFHDFVNKLIDISVAAESDDALKDVALDAIMDFVKMGKGGKFQSAIYYKLVRRIVHATSAIDTLLDMLAMKYFNHVDVRYFTYISLSKVLSNFEQSIAVSNKATSHNDGDLPKAEIQHAIHTIYKLLSSLPPPTTNKEQDFEMWSESGLATKDAGKVAPTDTTNGSSVILNKKFCSANQITKKLKSRFTRAWISFLKLPLPVDVYKEILASIHQNVIPYMANPFILCDFLTRSYDIGGVISVMALSGLFILMTEHGLEYPKFYEKLYALLTPTVFLAKHRAVFFQLLDSCLKSSYLSAHLAAAFTKKLSRLALSVPPSGELIIIALIHNLLRRHPSINFLVHQAAEDEDNRESSLEDSKSMAADIGGVDLSEKAGIDPFKIEENDPLKSNAMRSSLWEIETLRHHYSPAVSRFVASLENDLTVRAKTSEVAISDFSSGSYATVFRDEIRRRIKQVPLAFYRSTPSSLFCSSDFAGWSFGDQQSDQPEEA